MDFSSLLLDLTKVKTFNTPEYMTPQVSNLLNCPDNITLVNLINDDCSLDSLISLLSIPPAAFAPIFTTGSSVTSITNGIKRALEIEKSIQDSYKKAVNLSASISELIFI